MNKVECECERMDEGDKALDEIIAKYKKIFSWRSVQ